MEISLGQVQCSFQAWKPELGQVFQNGFAFDSETTLIDEERDWLSPAYVLGAAYDGENAFFIMRERLADFFSEHRGVQVAMHNAPFDLAVIHTLDPTLNIYSWVDDHQVWDTQLLHRLLVLGTDGHTAGGKGQSTLDSCVAKYLGIDLSKNVTDSSGLEVRTYYSKWLNRPSQEIEPVYLEYLGKDVIATYCLASALFTRLNGLLSQSSDVWGYVSREWLTQQNNCWGYQTHHVQLKGAIVLREIKANGLSVDLGQRNQLLTQLQEVADEYRNVLRTWGYIPGQKGSSKALQEIIRQIERQNPDVFFPKTETGKYVTKQDVLSEIADSEPFISTYLKFRAVEQLRSTFLEKMGRSRLHPSFQPLLVTGRTSSYGEINAQNLPRDDRVRSCFVPSRSNVFINADYASIEMVTLAQAIQSQFGQPSAMANALNSGQDLHRLVAAKVTGKSIEDVTSAERSKAKPINFGKPGGMGNAGLQRYAKNSYGVELSDSEVQSFTDSWFELFPEMRNFLQNDDKLGLQIATLFGLTEQSQSEHAGGPSSDWRGYDNRDNRPKSILGWMCRRVLLDATPQHASGQDYPAKTIDYLWSRVETKAHLLSNIAQAAIRLRQPSSKLAWEVGRYASQQSCFTLTGRLRASASYCARHNTVFQGLAADGAKLALWRLWRAGYRIVNFIHDEVLVEVSENSDLHQHAESIRAHMIAGMTEVIPNVSVDVKYAASRRWYKEAEKVIDADGRLIPWEPALDPRA